VTRPGVAVAIGSVGLLVAGRILGVVELYIAGVAGLGLVAVALLVVLRPPPALEVVRSVRPSRVHAGTASRVELRVANRGPRRSPVVTLADGVTGTAGARLLLGRLRPEQSVIATYRLPTERRGIVRIGPLDIEIVDPFGLVRRRIPAGSTTELTVLPPVVDLLPLPFTLGDDPLAGAEQPNHLGRTGEDFYALRPYVVGDELRRVHWPSTARTGELQVRQDEQPWQGRVTVLLDVRRTTTDGPGFERMVTAAASVIAASGRRGDLVRLVTTGGIDTGAMSGHAQLEALMEHLSVVELTPSGSLGPTLASLADGTGSLVAVVGDIPQGDLDTIVGLQRRSGSVTVLHMPGRLAVPLAEIPAATTRHGRIRLVRVAKGAELGATWNEAVRGQRQRGRARVVPSR
jgi:uncharacterized protein (DUF58 family)